MSSAANALSAHDSERELLTGDEVAWLNDYHAEVARRVGPLVEGPARAWLEERTKPI